MMRSCRSPPSASQSTPKLSFFHAYLEIRVTSCHWRHARVHHGVLCGRNLVYAGIFLQPGSRKAKCQVWLSESHRHEKGGAVIPPLARSMRQFADCIVADRFIAQRVGAIQHDAINCGVDRAVCVIPHLTAPHVGHRVHIDHGHVCCPRRRVLMGRHACADPGERVEGGCAFICISRLYPRP